MIGRAFSQTLLAREQKRRNQQQGEEAAVQEEQQPLSTPPRPQKKPRGGLLGLFGSVGTSGGQNHSGGM